jgi:hypothetical protein
MTSQELATNGLLLRYHSNDYAFSQSKHPPCIVLKLTEHKISAASLSFSNAYRPVLTWTIGDQHCGTIDSRHSIKIRNATDDELLSRPAVATNKLFCVSSRGKELFFEAKNEKEKCRIMHGLDLVFNWISEVGVSATTTNHKPKITNCDIRHLTSSNNKMSGINSPCYSSKRDAFMYSAAVTGSEDEVVPHSVGYSSNFLPLETSDDSSHKLDHDARFSRTQEYVFKYDLLTVSKMVGFYVKYLCLNLFFKFL